MSNQYVSPFDEIQILDQKDSNKAQIRNTKELFKQHDKMMMKVLPHSKNQKGRDE